MKTCSPNSVHNSGLLIAAALPVELRLLIDHFSAVRQEAGPWPVYCNADRSVVLLETGIGMLAAAAALSHAMGYLSIPACWSVLNVGIAGSGSLPVGQWVLAQEVVDTSNDARFYLRPPRIKGIERSCIHSHAAPSDDYSATALLDMEAAGMVAAAKRFVALEQIAVAKLVSDNNVEQQSALNKQAVLTLMQDNFSKLIPVLDRYQQYSAKEHQATDLAALPSTLLEKIHFSVSHKRKLDRLWRSYRVFYPPSLDVGRFSTARDVIAYLERKLRQVSNHWEEECV
jgi:hypothetical protein